MTTDICSIWAYHEIIDSGYMGEKQSMYLAVFSENPDRNFTHKQAVREIYTQFGVRVPVYDGRITELEKKGFLKKDAIIKCEFTRKKVNAWIYTGRRSPKEYEMVTKCCPKCKGFGMISEKEYS